MAKTPQEKLQEQMTLMKLKRTDKAYITESKAYALHQAENKLCLQERMEEKYSARQAKLALSKKIASAEARLAASEADKLKLRKLKELEARENKEIRELINPKEEDVKPTSIEAAKQQDHQIATSN